jgi:hypothetical protein
VSDEPNEPAAVDTGPVTETQEDLLDVASKLANATAAFLSPYSSKLALRALASVVANQICIRCRGSALNVLAMQSDVQRWATQDIIATIKEGAEQPAPEAPQPETSDEVVPAGVRLN